MFWYKLPLVFLGIRPAIAPSGHTDPPDPVTHPAIAPAGHTDRPDPVTHPAIAPAVPTDLPDPATHLAIAPAGHTDRPDPVTHPAIAPAGYTGIPEPVTRRNTDPAHTERVVTGLDHTGQAPDTPNLVATDRLTVTVTPTRNTAPIPAEVTANNTGATLRPDKHDF